MTTLKSYLDFKESGVEWLGKIPVHWGVASLRQLSGIAGGMTPSKNRPDYWVGDVPWISPKDMKQFRIGTAIDSISREAVRDTGLTLLPAGSVVVVVRGMILARKVPVAVTESRVTINQDMKALLPAPRIDSYYMARTLSAGQGALFPLIDEAGHGTRRLPTPSLMSVLLPVPPLDEQRAIATFLDAMDARITRFIAARKKMIRLLEEKKQAVINQAVTNGLAPSVPVKNSGVEWLGEIPAHWEVRKVKQLANGTPKSFTDGDWIESPYIQDEGIRLIQTGNVARGNFREQGYRYISEETFRELRCTEVEVGNILVCRLGDPVGRACLAPNLGVRMITSVDVCIVKPAHDVDPAYIVFAMSSDGYLEWVKAQVRGSTRDRVSRSMLGSFAVPFPPSPEQQRISAALAEQTATIETAQNRAEREIELMQEYRTRLISDIVTGKLDVRGVVLGELPESGEIPETDTPMETEHEHQRMVAGASGQHD
jgi:type I restriction enzyme, S subunit